MIIAIDGPSGTGKSTVAHELAKRLGFIYFDTGAMYRAITLRLQQLNVALDDMVSLKKILESFAFNIKNIQAHPHYFIADQEITTDIRSASVTGHVSEVAASPIVRKHLVKIQRRFAQGKDAVFEGRDMGTVVFPKAEFKFYLDADPSERTNRRYQELLERHGAQSPSKEEVCAALKKRDELDSTREISPLRQAEDAVFIDTTVLSVEEVIQKIMTCMEKKEQ